MADKSVVITYEVHTLKRGEWTVHSRHAEQSFDEAIRAAKGLERTTTIDGVKVVRDAYDSTTGKSKTTTEYGAARARRPGTHR